MLSKISNAKPVCYNPPKSLNLSFTNIRGIRSNFGAAESFLLQNSPDLLVLCETNLNPGISSFDFHVDSYLLLQHLDSDCHMHGLAVYVCNSLPIPRESRFQSSHHSFMCFHLALLHTISYLFFLYSSPSFQDCTLIDVVSENIDKIPSSCPSANIFVFSDFNTHHTTWLKSNPTDASATHILNFSLSQSSLSQIVSFPTCYPDNNDHAPSLLDLCLVSDPSICPASPHAPLRNSDHIVVSLDLTLTSPPSCKSPVHHTSYNYQQGGWESFRYFLRDAPWNNMFSLSAYECASEVISWIHAGNDAFVPHCHYQVKGHTSPWFLLACVTATAHRNHYFHLYCQDNSSDNECLFALARSRCKKVLNDAKSRYMESTESRISSQK